MFPSQTGLGQWYSSLDPHFNWIGPWLGWKAIYVETLYSEFLSAKFYNVSSTFFVYILDQKKIPSHKVLGQWHSSLDPRFIWRSPCLGWKAIYVETLYSEFLSAIFDNVSSNFFVHTLDQKKNSLSESTRTVTLIPRASIHLNKSSTRLQINLFWNTK